MLLQGHTTPSRFNRNLDNVTSVHLQQSILVIRKLINVGDHALDIQFPAVDVGNSAAKCQILGEGRNDLREQLAFMIMK